jgi:glutathione peroxidase-family protein
LIIQESMTDIFKLVKDVQETDTHMVGHSCLSQKSVFAEEKDSFKKDIKWLFKKYAVGSDGVAVVFNSVVAKFEDFDSGLTQDLACRITKVTDAKYIQGL